MGRLRKRVLQSAGQTGSTAEEVMSNANRNLRLGIVYRGSIIHEEQFDRKIDISIGRRAGSTVHIAPKQYPDFPEFIDFLTCDNGVFYLVVPADPNARVNLRGAASNQDVRTVKGKKAIPIEDIAGGSLGIGEVTVMFQFVRGDSHPTMTRERTVLRLGLVFEERLIDDRIFPDTKLVSVGTGRECTIVLPEEDYQGPPISFENHKDGSVTMRAPAAMKVRLAVDGAPMELKDLQAKGKARQEGNDIVCHLSLGTRGRAIVGQHTLLVQVIKQTVTVPVFAKKSFPERVMAGVLAEPAWWISFAVSAMFILGLVFQAAYFEKNTNRFLGSSKASEEASKTTYEVVVEEKEEIKEPPPDPEEDKKPTAEIMPESVKAKADKPAEKAKDAPKADAGKADKPASLGEKQADPDEAKRQARAAIEQKTIAGAFGGPQGGAATKLFGEAAEGEAGEVVAKSFGGDPGAGNGDARGPGAGGVKLAGSSGGGTVEKVKAGSGGKGFGERKAEETKVEGKKEEAAITVKLSSGGVDGPGENKAEVAKVVSRKNSAVQRCYEEALRDNPDEGGKVKVTFTVGTEGTITDVSVSGASGKFSDCIKAKFSAIRGLPLLTSPQTFSQSYVFSKGS